VTPFPPASAIPAISHPDSAVAAAARARIAAYFANHPCHFAPKFSCGLVAEPFTRRLRRYLALSLRQRPVTFRERPPLSLVIALDVSSSMSGFFDEVGTSGARVPDGHAERWGERDRSGGQSAFG